MISIVTKVMIHTCLTNCYILTYLKRFDSSLRKLYFIFSQHGQQRMTDSFHPAIIAFHPNQGEEIYTLIIKKEKEEEIISDTKSINF